MSDVPRVPSLLPAAAFATGIGLALGLAPRAPVAGWMLLVACGAALAGVPGRLVAWLAFGGIVGGQATPIAVPDRFDRHVVAAVGRVCGLPVDGAFGAAVPLCAESLAAGAQVLVGPLRLRLDLPSELPVPPLGARVRARGTLDRWAGFANERTEEPGRWRLRVKSARFIETVQRPGPVARLSEGLRRPVVERFAAASAIAGPSSGDGLALARSLLLGDAQALSEAHRRALRRTGLAHLIAVSGFNVSLVALLAGGLTIGRTRPVRLAAVALAIALYLLLVGPAPSVLRAATMALLVVAGLALRRTSAALQGLGLAALVLLAATPGVIADVGFLLSFSATVGLLVVAPRWVERRPGWTPRWLAVGLGATLAAQATSLPVSVAAFGEFSPLAPLLNLVAVPWAAVSLAAAVAWLVTSFVAPPLAGPLVAGLDLLARPLDLLAALPAGGWVAVCWPGGLVAGLAAALPLVAIGERGRRGATLALVGLLGAQVGHGRMPEPRFEALFLDVGQGDATVLRRGLHTLLIDGGGTVGLDIGSRVLLPALTDRAIAEVDLAIVSHADTDHCQGVADLAARIPIRRVWLPAGAADSPCHQTLARSGAARVELIDVDQRRRSGPFDLELFARPGTPGRGGSNADSLVVRVEAGGRRLLFPGDIDAHRERELVRVAGARLRVDLIHVAHHGSAGSSSPAFLAAGGAPLAVVSAGVDSRYGHPSPAALARLAATGARTVRLDRDGVVRLTWRPYGPWRIELPSAPRSRASRR